MIQTRQNTEIIFNLFIDALVSLSEVREDVISLILKTYQPYLSNLKFDRGKNSETDIMNSFDEAEKTACEEINSECLILDSNEEINIKKFFDSIKYAIQKIRKAIYDD